MKSIQKISLIFAFLLSVLIFSCKNEEKTADKEEAVTETPSAEEMKEKMTKNAELKYNPAHGEEGHRCELPVGAPLESAKTSSTPQLNTSPVRMQSATPRINPPHGEPGHDCSVAVGAELK